MEINREESEDASEAKRRAAKSAKLERTTKKQHDYLKIISDQQIWNLKPITSSFKRLPQKPLLHTST